MLTCAMMITVKGMCDLLQENVLICIENNLESYESPGSGGQEASVSYIHVLNQVLYLYNV